MKRNLRSTAMALAAMSLVVVFSAACSPQEMQRIFESLELRDPHAGPEPRGQAAWGEMEFLAPGELAVDGQSISVSEDTEIIGGIYACSTENGAGPNGYGTVECDQETLESTLQENTIVIAHSVMDEDGNALSITEFSGTVTGALQYLEQDDRDLGPLETRDHEYFIGTTFSVDEDTEIIGGIYACSTENGAGPDGYGTVECDQESLNATLQERTIVYAEVVMNSDRVAESITEYECEDEFSCHEVIPTRG